MKCKSCDALSGKKRISPGVQIYEGTHWVVEHAYPTSIEGWMVVVLKRHVTSLHELNGSEWAEMTILQNRIVEILHSKFKTEKEYIAIFAEAEGFEHIHMHIIPKTNTFPPAHKGSRVFNLVGNKVDKPISEDEVINLCQQMKKLF